MEHQLQFHDPGLRPPPNRRRVMITNTSGYIRMYSDAIDLLIIIMLLLGADRSYAQRLYRLAEFFPQGKRQRIRVHPLDGLLPEVRCDVDRTGYVNGIRCRARQGIYAMDRARQNTPGKQKRDRMAVGPTGHGWWLHSRHRPAESLLAAPSAVF
jgi:hypothetical protein